MEESVRGRHREQCRDFPAAAGLTEDRHVAGIATEFADVIAHPFERLDDVEHADITRRRKLRAALLGQIRKTEHVQAVIERDDDDIAVAREIRAVRQR